MLHGEDYVGAVRGFRAALHRPVAEVRAAALRQAKIRLSKYNRQLRGHFRGENLEAAEHLVWIATDDTQLYGSYIGCRGPPHNNIMHPVCLKALLPRFDCVCPWVKIVDAESPVTMCVIPQ